MTSFNLKKPEKKLISILPKNSGRNNSGKITQRRRGGRQKRYYREIDFKRDKHGIWGRIVAFEYDPNRNTDLALVYYPDGDKRYILSCLGLKVGDSIISGEKVEIKEGNNTKMVDIPIGVQIHNVELQKGRGGQIVRSAGASAQILAKEGGFVHIKLPSGEIRKIDENCNATIGQLGNIDQKNKEIGKAGRKRLLGRRPKVRGTAQHPGSHPHGGGEGRSGEGMHPKTPWGKPARGKKTRKKGKYSDKYIISKRRK